MMRMVVFSLAAIYASFTYSNDDFYEHRVLPSFNCYKASTDIEKMICENSWVSALDSVLNVYYEEALKTESRDEVKSSQRDWMKNRMQCVKENPATLVSAPLQQCYQYRIEEIRNQYGIKDTKEILEKISLKLGVLLYSSDASDGEKFIALKNFSDLVYGLGESLCSYIPEKIYRHGEYTVSTRVHGSSVCGGTSVPANERYQYCEKENGDFIPGSVWACFDEKGYARIVTDTLKKNSYQKFFTLLRSEITDEKNDIKKEQNPLIQFLYSDAIHSIASETMFSKKFLELYSGSRNLIHSLLNYDVEDYRKILSGMQCTYDMIHKSSRWEQIFESSVPTTNWQPIGNYWYGKQFKGCDAYNIDIAGERYSQKELYVLFWKLFFENKTTKYAKQILDAEIEMLPPVDTLKTDKPKS